VWHGVVTSPRGREVKRWGYPDGEIRFRKGDEVGRFNMGSTVILLAGPGAVAWSEVLRTGVRVRMGERIATAAAQFGGPASP